MTVVNTQTTFVQYLLLITAEEIVFRFWMQSHLGLTWTALLFFAAHGYFFVNIIPFTRNVALTVGYRALLLGVCFLLGWVYREYGLPASLLTHLAFNQIVFITQKYKS